MAILLIPCFPFWSKAHVVFCENSSAYLIHKNHFSSCNTVHLHKVIGYLFKNYNKNARIKDILFSKVLKLGKLNGLFRCYMYSVILFNTFLVVEIYLYSEILKKST